MLTGLIGAFEFLPSWKWHSIECNTVVCRRGCKCNKAECLPSWHNLLGGLRDSNLFISPCFLLLCYFSNLYFHEVLPVCPWFRRPCKPDTADGITWQVAIRVRVWVDLCSSQTYVHLPSAAHKWYDSSFVMLSGTRGKSPQWTWPRTGDPSKGIYP